MTDLGCDGRAVPDGLYHYTSAAGLLGILTSRTLWATDSAFLDDPTEGLLGRDEAMRRLEVRRNELMDDGPWDEDSLEASILDQLHEVIDSLKKMGTEPIRARQGCYVASFSSDGDVLSQWRGYGDGGYAIGFHTSAMDRFDLVPPKGRTIEHYARMPFLRQVSYGVDSDLSLDEALEHVAPDGTGHPGIHAHQQCYNHVLPALMTIKHEAFREEREWRLFNAEDLPRGLVRTREGPVGLVPHVNMTFPEDAVHSVVVGPGPNGDLRLLAAQQLLHSSWHAAPPVVPSSAPLR